MGQTINFDEIVNINGVELRAVGEAYVGNGDDDDRDEIENMEVYAPDSKIDLYNVLDSNIGEVESQVWDKVKYG
jgi:hypothetical protein